MTKEKACRNCKTIFNGVKCPKCGESEGVDSFKGKVSILNPERSEIASKLGIKAKGFFAIRLK